MFLLPNQNKIDESGVIEAMLHTDSSCRYFLDTTTGEIGCVEKKTTKNVSLDMERYIEVPKLSEAVQFAWMKKFIETMLETESLLSRALKNEIEKGKGALACCEKILNEDAGKWIHGWREWCKTSAFEEMQKWLGTLPISIEEKFEGHGDCELCKLMERGEHNLGDFMEAKAKEDRKLNTNEDHTVGRLSLAKAEQQFLESLKRCGMEGFFSMRTFKKWCTNESKYDLLFASRALFFLAPEMTRENDGVALTNAAIELANRLPRKKLGGKSPLDFRESNPDHSEQKYKMDTYDRNTYATLNEEALRFMRSSEYERAYRAYEGIIQKLLVERTPFFSAFRAYANAAVCCFLGNDELPPLGEQLLEAALRINPLYDFALQMREYYVAPQNDFSGVSKKDRNFAKTLRALMQDIGASAYRRTPFRKYERFLSECGVSLTYKTKTIPTVRRINEKGQSVKIGRNDPCYCNSGKKFKKCHGGVN